MSLKYLELKNTSENCSKLIFILHGYGADSNDLFSIATYWQRFLPDAFFCVPNAPNSCQVNPAGFEWFDLMQTDNDKITQESLVSLEKLQETIDQKLDDLKIEHNKLILVGFSQGTMMSLHVGLRRKSDIGGIVGFSGAMTLPENWEAEITSKPPVLLVHGDVDNVVPVQMMHEAFIALKEFGIDVENHVSPSVMHNIGPDGLQKAMEFLAKV